MNRVADIRVSLDPVQAAAYHGRRLEATRRVCDSPSNEARPIDTVSSPDYTELGERGPGAEFSVANRLSGTAVDYQRSGRRFRYETLGDQCNYAGC